MGERPIPSQAPVVLENGHRPILDADELNGLLAGVGFTKDEAQRLLGLALPAVGLLGLGGCSEGAVGASHLGGRPDVPPGWQWPSTDGYPQGLVAELDLADLEGFDAACSLPSGGHLAFFYAFFVDTLRAGPGPRQRTWTVEWYPPGQELVRAPYPDWPHGEIPEVSSPSPLQFFAMWSFPSLYSSSVVDLVQRDGRYLDFYAAHQEAIEGRLGRRWPFHQLMGHPSGAIQGDPIEELFAGEANEAGVHAGDQWRNFLQIDSDENSTDMLWGDGGLLFFLGPMSGLRQNEFASCWLEFQS